MVILFIILSDEDQMEEILEGFLEIGITGATVIPAHGMGEFLSQEVPIFAGFRNLFPGREGKHRLLMSVTSGDKARLAVRLLEQIHGPLAERGAGVAFTVPVDAVWGLAEEF